MTLATSQAAFVAEIVDLCDNATPTTTVYKTADAIESYWSNAYVTGFPMPTAVFVPKTSYGPLAPIALIPPTGTPLSAAAAFEAALAALVVASTFVILLPAFTTPPPIPVLGGPATPGTLTSALTTIFSTPSLSSVAATAAGLFAAYLQTWTIATTIPPAASAPVLII